MSLVQEKFEQMQEKVFDQAIESLKIQHKYVKEALLKDKNFQEVVIVMKEMKSKLNSLYSKDPAKIKFKTEMIVKLCEQIAYCLLRDNKPKEALKFLSELEVIQDVVKEKNSKAFIYMGRTHMMLQNFKQANNYFSKAYKFADQNAKKDIEGILHTIKLKINEDNEDSDALGVSKFMQNEIGQTSTALVLESELNLIPMGFQSVDADGDITIEVLEAKQQAESICKKNKGFTETVEICTNKASAGILGEYLQKSRNPLATYKVDHTTQDSSCNKTFHMSCECVEHVTFGSATTKIKAKEIAAQKMLKYLQDAGKLRLTTNLEL
ncbi:unnamed protein product [Chironomus riparius]|uniref:DRBM domain-containing protein n=1 Tax=Chironomus riparius TaxID=315576 RepID=A0A9N9RYD6_9DIPT|nr:unnamed protein product [Chironomus riparius]